MSCMNIRKRVHALALLASAPTPPSTGTGGALGSDGDRSRSGWLQPGVMLAAAAAGATALAHKRQ